MDLNAKRFECHLNKKALAVGVGMSLLTALNAPMFAGGATPTSQPVAVAAKYDPTLAERAKETVQTAMNEMKKAGETIAVKVKETAAVDITEQVRQQLAQFEEKTRDGKVSLKDALAVIDVMRTQADSLLKFIGEAKSMNLAETKERAVASLIQLSQQLTAKANQIEVQANATGDPKWSQKLHELAAAADRFARGYAKWADHIRAYPIEIQLRQLHLAEEYLRRAKELLDLQEAYIRISDDYVDFTVQVGKFMTQLTELNYSIQKFAKLVHDAPSEMPAVGPEGKVPDKATTAAPSKNPAQAGKVN